MNTVGFTRPLAAKMQKLRLSRPALPRYFAPCIGMTVHLQHMKKVHIILLVGVAIAIAVMISFTGDLTTYDTIASARQKPGEYVHLIARLDKSQPVQYDPVVNPNYCAFTVVDSLGGSTKVISFKPKPADLEVSERVVLKGRMKDGSFECDDILLKCPSKYKDDMNAAQKQLDKAS